jgi:RNA polymerase sigma-70 factor (ECF subfamily)
MRDEMVLACGEVAAMAGISHKAAAAHESSFGSDAAEIQDFIPAEQAGQVLRLLLEQDASEERERDIDQQTFSGNQEQQILALYREYRPRLFRYLHSLNLKRDPAEEVIQETFMRLTVELEKKGSMENVQGWVVRVAHNLAMKRRKDSTRDAVISSDSPLALKNYADPGLSPEETYLKNERISRMETALSSFSALNQQCFHMRVQGFRYKDIAMALGISEQRVAFVVKQVAMRLAAICG